MGILLKLERFYHEVIFEDSLLGLLINPFYISRRALFHNIRDCALSISGGRLLDVGCGSAPYKGQFSVDEYIGLDIEESGHNHQKSNVDVFYDGKTIPFSDSCFDHVFSSEVFEHVFNLSSLLTEINRVTKDGGTLLVTVPFCWDEHEIPFDCARYTSFGLHYMLEQHGFSPIRSFKTTSYIETIFQLLAAYVSQCVLPENRYLRVFLTPFFVSPFNILGLILGALLPNNENLYLNNVVLCRKTGLGHDNTRVCDSELQ